MTLSISPVTPGLAEATPKPEAADEDARLQAAAKQFEAAFIRQMLDHAGFAEAFGAGEGGSADAMSSFLIDHLATEISDQGAFGLAEHFYNKLSAASGDADTGPGKRL